MHLLWNRAGLPHRGNLKSRTGRFSKHHLWNRAEELLHTVTVVPPRLLCAEMKREKTLSVAHNWNDHHAQSLVHISLSFAREQSTEHCCRTPAGVSTSMSKKNHQCGLPGERRKIHQTLRKVAGQHEEDETGEIPFVGRDTCVPLYPS